MESTNALKKYREQANLTQIELAVKAGVGLTTVYRVENGFINETTIGSMRKICNALGCTLSSFFAESG